MIRYPVEAPPFTDVRTGIKFGPERLGLGDAPGMPKTKTSAVIPEGILNDVELPQLPNGVRCIARKICASDVCIIKSGIEQNESTAELWASCTGQCFVSEHNIPERAIIETGLRVAAVNGDLMHE